MTKVDLNELYHATKVEAEKERAERHKQAEENMAKYFEEAKAREEANKELAETFASAMAQEVGDRQSANDTEAEKVYLHSIGKHGEADRLMNSKEQRLHDGYTELSEGLF
ncbi:hypothetical protein QP860_03465 [Aerococcus sp. UMB1112A]|uniref:hypothetical protein n=1 Tax=Aerococcus sp. UMB1112A TaxID=3050609 RepID=UPI00254B93D0|nr:hypothetical protein [Aerococcus sp. UMB1112A]MDK8502107.1 hypothetical protein [Aerococcus sp. UMB1112A]